MLGLESISAVIVAANLSHSLVDSILNARAHLRHQDPIFVVTTPKNFFYFDQASWQGLNVQALHAVSMPNSVPEYSDLLVSCEFWRHFQTDFVLVFQTDSRFCSTSTFDIQDFAAYGYPMIGAPWDTRTNRFAFQTTQSHVGNGGFSLRKRSAMLTACLEIDGPNFTRQMATEIEDVYFAHYFSTATQDGEWTTCPKFVAEQVAVEGFYANKGKIPLGVHKPYANLKPNNPIFFSLSTRSGAITNVSQRGKVHPNYLTYRQMTKF